MTAHRHSLLALALAACWSGPQRPASPDALRPGDPGRAGRAVYRKACASCHGMRGTGDGPGAPGMYPRPRDFTRANYRYRTTATGELPLEADLVRTVTDGIAGTSMPAWGRLLSPQEIRDVVAYIEGFNADFADEDLEPKPIEIPAPPPFSPESVARGAKVYAELECGECHGKRGEGDGWAKDDQMRNADGEVVYAADLTRGIYRSGRTRRALYRSIVTGLAGTPMPAYEAMPPDKVYDLIHYVLSLEDGGALDWLATPPRWYERCEWRVPR